MSSTSNRRRLVLTAFVVCVVTFTAGAAVAQYLGNGYFPTRNLAWAQAGVTTNYTSPANDGMANWTSTTDLNFTKTSSSNWDIRVYPYNFGATQWAGLAYICSTSTCNNSTAWNQTFYYCDAYLNHYWTGSQSYSVKRNTVMHEVGHCVSLAHRNTTSSIMYPSQQTVTTPNSYDRSLVNARY